MLKFFGRDNIVRDSEVFDGTTKYNNLEFYTTNDTKTGHDIERPIENIYQNQYEIINFLEEFASQEISNDGVFANSLTTAFEITAADVTQVIVDSTYTNYIRIPPGIAAINHTDINTDSRSNSIIVVNKPSLRIAEKQIAKLLGLNLPYGVESVEIKHLGGYKAKIVKTFIGTRITTTYFYGCVNQTEFDNTTTATSATGFELLADMYNEVDLKSFYVTALAGDLTKIILEPFFNITAIDQYYFIVDKADGEIKMITTVPDGEQFQLSTVNVTGIANDGGFTQNSIDNTHLFIGSTKVIETADTTADSFKVVSAGGINLTASSLPIVINGDLTVTGTTTTVNTTDLEITDNIITLNSGESGVGVTTLDGTAGIVVDRGTKTDYNIIFDEADDNLRIGEVGSEQAVATRQDNDTITNGVCVIWNSTTNKFESSAVLAPPIAVTEFEYDSQTDFNWTERDTGTDPASGFILGEMINNNRQDLYELVELLSTEGASYSAAAGAALIGTDGITGVTPTGKLVNGESNLQAMIEGLFALITTKTSSATFPSSPKLGDECYRTDLDEWYKFNSVIWMQI